MCEEHQNAKMWKKMDGSLDYYFKWNNPDIEWQIPQDLSHMQILASNPCVCTLVQAWVRLFVGYKNADLCFCFLFSDSRPPPWIEYKPLCSTLELTQVICAKQIPFFPLSYHCPGAVLRVLGSKGWPSFPGFHTRTFHVGPCMFYVQCELTYSPGCPIHIK